MAIPPLSADCETTVEFKQPGMPPKTFGWRMFRSTDGKLRIDFGDTSVISVPSLKQTITLDHLKKEARVFPMPKEPQIPGLPGGLPFPREIPSPDQVNVQELGTQLIEGQEAEGKRYIFNHKPELRPPVVHAPHLPKAPELPKLPSLQQHHVPTREMLTHAVEVWTSTKTRLPVLTRMTQSTGQQINRCKCAGAGEPPAVVFQVPAGYKLVEAPAPKTS